MTAIEILDIPAGFPQRYIENDGRLFLDVEANFKLSLTRQLEELTELNKIKIGGVLGFNLPRTDKNWLLFGQYFNPSEPDKVYAPFDCNLWVGTHVLRQNLLYVRDTNFTTISIDIKDGSNHWIISAKDKSLSSLDLDTFEMTTANIIDNQTNNDSFVDGGVGVYFPDVWYGRLSFTTVTPKSDPDPEERTIIVPDYRPFHYVLNILRKGFSSIGWNFNSPVLETAFGRKLATYIIGKDFFASEEILQQRTFSVGLQNDVEFVFNGAGELSPPWDSSNNWNTPILFDKKFIDDGDNYDVGTGYYTGNVTASFFFQVHYYMETDKIKGWGTALSFTLNIQRAGNNQGAVDEERIVINSPFYKKYNLDSTVTIGASVGEISLNPGDAIFCNIHIDDNDIRKFTIFADTTKFFNLPTLVQIAENQVLDLAGMIDSSYSLLDYLKGISHLFSFKFDTNFATREVTAYPPYDLDDFHGEAIEGYFKANSVVDLDSFTFQKNSEISETPQAKLKRFNILTFAVASDDAIKRLQAPADKPLFSHKYDIGSDFVEGKQFYKNPFFEPTLNNTENSYASSIAPTNLPNLVDNAVDNENLRSISYDIKPRILYIHGLTEQWAQDISVIPNTATQITLRKFGVDETQIAFAYQQSDAIVGWDNFPIDPIRPTVDLVYGDSELQSSLFELFYRAWWRLTLSNLRLSVLIILHQKDYFNWSFRDTYKFIYYGKPINVTLLEINDFNSNEILTTPIVFLPEAQSLFIDALPTPDEDCKNYPIINTVVNGLCYEFTLGTNNVDSPVLGTTWEWKYLDESTWTLLAVGPPYSVCSPDRPFQVRATVDYGDVCASSIITRFINACGNNNPTLILTETSNANQQPVITAEVTGNSSPVSGIVITYTIDGGIPLTYIAPLVNVLGLLTFTAVVSYADACADKTTTNFINVIPLDEELPDGYWVTFEVNPHNGDTYIVPLLDNPPDWEGVTLPDPNQLGILAIRRRVKVYRNGQQINYVIPPASGMGEFHIVAANNSIVFGLPLNNARLYIEVFKVI